ncbi:pyrroline-5-carboxylate reductase [Chelativorans sp. Marseille-P2723]|uniref:pyrroline-5-carboxylate reductase n=1 Tax=Chelativorans sp. Marseille-P2723 TaxID=2709133 RepID=UPI001570C477|nr:pyrroline-5-carboxylate reductase [Chelativorans sp. Marseille-P2723]
MSKKVVLVGCGNMGYAMLKGWIKAGRLSAADMAVIEPDEALRTRAAALGVTALSQVKELVLRPDLVVFAVKPQIIRDVVPAYRKFAPAASFLSVAAGTGVSTFEEILGSRTAIIRCMPNTPASIGKGMMVIYANAHVAPEMKVFIEGLCSATGAVATIEDEALMDAVTAVSGSGPAYVFHFIECLTAAAEKAGLPSKIARLLAVQTVYGAAALAQKSGEEPGALREQVTSPNGTTAAALSVLMGESRLMKLMEEAVEAARKRSIELG